MMDVVGMQVFGCLKAEARTEQLPSFLRGHTHSLTFPNDTPALYLYLYLYLYLNLYLYHHPIAVPVAVPVAECIN